MFKYPHCSNKAKPLKLDICICAYATVIKTAAKLGLLYFSYDGYGRGNNYVPGKINRKTAARDPNAPITISMLGMQMKKIIDVQNQIVDIIKRQRYSALALLWAPNTSSHTDSTAALNEKLY